MKYKCNNPYHYRILTNADLDNFESKGVNILKWLARNWDNLTKLHNGAGKFLGYKLPKGMRLPSLRIYTKKSPTPILPVKPQPDRQVIKWEAEHTKVPLTPTRNIAKATNFLKSTLGD